MQEKLRIAVLSSGFQLYAWQHLVLKEIEGSDHASIVLNINMPHKTLPKMPWAWKIYSRLDNCLFNPVPNALTVKDAVPFFKETIKYTEDNLIESNNLSKYKLDVIINFSDGLPPTNLIPASTFGIWNLIHPPVNNKEQGPPGSWELLMGLPTIEVSLQAITNGMTHPIVLDKTIACTDWISYSRNANSIYWQAYPLINRNLKKLYEKRDYRHFNAKVSLDSGHNTFTYPSTVAILWHFTKTLLKKTLQLTISKIYFEQWILLYSNSVNSDPYDLSQYKRILPPKDRFWADPFLIKRNGKHYLFIEELVYKDKLGHIAVMELDENGNHTVPKTILKKEYHLSYPFLFQDQGELYMIPETGGNKDIQLYKCINFPYEWELEKVLMQDVHAVDTTIYKKDNIYWMFTNLKVHKGMSANVELFLFHSKELVSDQWTPHPLNPVITDVRKSRPAGQFFVDKGNLIRPSQNCSRHYGYGMSINQIDRLDESDFHEEILHSIDPNWERDIICTHTFNSCDKIYISDAKIKRRRF